jgi:hypothetical protein
LSSKSVDLKVGKGGLPLSLRQLRLEASRQSHFHFPRHYQAGCRLVVAGALQEFQGQVQHGGVDRLGGAGGIQMAQVGPFQ